ncbi:MAG: hydrogenase maturation protease [Nevskia sp.]
MLCIIGCGNSARSDDGVGVFVAQALQAQLRKNPQEHVRVFDAGTGGMDVMFQARGANRLIIIDASRSGSEAGAIFKVPGKELERDAEPGYSLHDFRWQHALSAGRKIFGKDFPSDVTVFLIEAQSLAFGLELSAPVLAAAQKVIADIQAVVETERGLAEEAAVAPSARLEVSIIQANVYLSRELCDAYLPGIMSVALLARDEAVLIVPLMQQSGGGLLLKQRNARGDRVIHAQDFFREKGFLEDFEVHKLKVHWSPESAALVLQGLPLAAAAARI